MIKSTLLIFLLSAAIWGQSKMTYRVDYPRSSEPRVGIAISPSKPLRGPVTMVFPRAIPGGYTQVFYDRYVEDVKAKSSSGRALKIERQQGSRWLIGDASGDVAQVEYELNVARMERETYDASETSKVRPGYVGLLGYSAFAYFDGMENVPIGLEVNVPSGWPVFSTLEPKAPTDIGRSIADASNYYQLADSQIAFGPKIEIHRLNAKVPFFLLTYAEVDSDAGQFGRIAADAFEKVSDLFRQQAVYSLHDLY